MQEGWQGFPCTLEVLIKVLPMRLMAGQEPLFAETPEAAAVREAEAGAGAQVVVEVDQQEASPSQEPSQQQEEASEEAAEEAEASEAEAALPETQLVLEPTQELLGRGHRGPAPKKRFKLLA